MTRLRFHQDVPAHSTSQAIIILALVGSNPFTVLTLTGLLRHIPLHVAFPLTTGLAVVGVQVGAARWLFHEPITPAQWLGTLLVVAGILFTGGR